MRIVRVVYKSLYHIYKMHRFVCFFLFSAVEGLWVSRCQEQRSLPIQSVQHSAVLRLISCKHVSSALFLCVSVFLCSFHYLVSFASPAWVALASLVVSAQVMVTAALTAALPVFLQSALRVSPNDKNRYAR